MIRNMIRTLLMLSAVALVSCSQAANNTVSPNGEISVKVYVSDSPGNELGQAFFDVNYQGSSLLSKTRIGLCTRQQRFTDSLRLVSVSSPQPIRETYDIISGKRSHCANEGTERVYRLENKDKQVLQVTFQVYDDGVAFRYAIDATGADPEYITDEYTVYSIPEGTRRWMQSYAVDYEGFFPLATDGQSTDRKKSQVWGYPALVEPQDSLFVLITEAGIRRGHSGSRLTNDANPDKYQIRTTDEKLAFSGSWTSPWRVLMVGSLADIVESTLVTDVSEPCTLTDTSWIVPGPAAWIYWAHNHGSRDYQIVKEYIDLAARMGWPYNLIDWEWDVMGNGGTMQDAMKYAQEKGVKTFLWYNSGTSWNGPGAPGPLDRLNTKEKRDKEFAWLREMGISGIKVDFFAADGADIMNYYMDILEDAARYQVMINFHGATIPRGWQRTYPNMMTVEGVYGAEWYNNRPILTDRAAAHNATLPFTRNVVGPMDYTPGTFSDSQHPHITSHGHELALPVVFESALQHMPDRPATYDSLPAEVRQFLSTLPTAWDETKLLSGYPGVEVVIARRKGEVWYIGGLNGTDKSKVLNFTPASLSGIGQTMTLFKDGADNRSFAIEQNVPLADGKMSIECLPRGGFVAIIR